MNEYKANELEDIEHPYEIEYSSLKSSKNESLKIQTINDNNNLLDINNSNSKNSQSNNNDTLFQHNSNNIKTINDDNIKQRNNNTNNMNNINKNIIYNKNNYMLNNNNKRNIEKILENSNNANYISIINNNENKSNSKTKTNSQSKNNIKNDQGVQNNIHIFSTINDYWEKRNIKNKEKMKKIKKEREKKLYGEIYPRPKINKNTQEIIERIKEREYDNISIEENMKEDQINKKIPIRTKQKNYIFKKGFYFNNNSSKKRTNSSSQSKINVKKGYNELMNIKINGKKRSKTPNLISFKKMQKNQKNKKLGAADIKNIELIKKLREEEENAKKKRIEERIKLENNYIEEKIKEEDEETSPEKGKSDKKRKNKNENNNNYNVDAKTENYLNKNNNLISFRSKSTKEYLNNSQNINDIMTSRIYLNDIYNIDKKIINHSFIQSSNDLCKSVPKFSNQKNIEIFYKNKNKLKRKNNNLILKNINNNYNNTSLYNPKTKSLRYKHYTEGGVYNYHNTSINNNNNISHNNNYNCNDACSPDYINKNFLNLNLSQRNICNINKKLYSNNNINNNNNVKKYGKEIDEKNNEMNLLYKKEYNYKNNKINEIENEFKENNILNQKLLDEAKKLNSDNNEYKKILLQNESINNIFNEIDNVSLLKYREENNQKLYELNQKKHNKKSNLPELLQKQFEESKDTMYQMNKDVYNKINSHKYKNILIDEQQKIENNLDYYNKELKINEKKKELLLNKMYGDNYTKNRKKINNENNKDIYFTESNNYILDVNKYLIKNNEINIIGKNKKNGNNKYKIIHSPYKNVGGIKTEVKKEDIFNDNYEKDILGSFDFQRIHHFS